MNINRKPIISILIPAYNHPNYTRECLDSIFSQQGFESEDIEVIMIDDKSPQDLSDLGNEYMKKYKNFYFERNEANKGMAGNWNYLLELKKGEYFIFLSNDDKFATNDSLRNIYNALIENKADVCYGKYVCFDEEAKLSEFIPHKKIGNHDIFLDTYSAQLKTHSISFGGILYKNFGYLYDVNAGMWADWEYNLQYLSQAKKILLIKSTTFLYRVHKNQGSSSMNYSNYIRASFHIIGKQKHIRILEKITLYFYHMAAMIITFFIPGKITHFLRRIGLCATIRRIYNKFYA